MLSAINERGELISIVNIEDKSLLNQAFFCPACKERVIVKTGSNRMWHFAHYHNSNCTASEPESEYHLLGKKLLYEWLNAQNKTVIMEKYFSNIEQRADLYADRPIEFQCSTISDGLFYERTKNYCKIGEKPIWILGGNRLMRVGVNLFRLKRMDWLALHEAKDDAYQTFLLYYCPKKDNFAYLANITPVSSTKVAANIHYVARNQLNYDALFKLDPSLQNSIDPKLWQKVKTNWRVYPNRRKQRAFYYINRMLLQINRSLPLFPSEAGMPTKYSFWIETPPYLWQTWMLLQFVFPPSNRTEFQFHEVYSQFQSLVQRKIFNVRKLPLLDNSHYSFALMEYLHCLCELGILAKTKKNTFAIKKNIELPHTLEEAMKMDEDLHRNR